VISLGQVRRIARTFPEVTEADHFGKPSFRIYKRIIATVPDSRHLNVMIDPFDVDGVVREEPEACSTLWWGKDVRGVQVDLALADARLVANLLEVAWRLKAPRRLVSSRSAAGAPGQLRA
jgi:hypothetical protein